MIVSDMSRGTVLFCALTAVVITSGTQQFIALCQRCVERIEKLSQQLVSIRPQSGNRLTPITIHYI